MEILHANAERDFMSMISLFSANPTSWEGWRSLHITLQDMKEDQEQDFILWAKSIIGSYLQNVEGRAYFCFGGDLHVICKGVQENILRQAAVQICDLVFSENHITATYEIFDLAKDTETYHQVAVRGHENLMSFIVPQAVDNPEKETTQKFKLYFEKQQAENNPSGMVKVLLVEDDPVARWMVRNALKHTCEFATATCANKAFAMYSSYQPDIVFLDIDLPDQNGRNVLDWIIRNDPGACVVMFSSNNTMDNISEALSMGASGFIPKPFLKENFMHYIENYETGFRKNLSH